MATRRRPSPAAFAAPSFQRVRRAALAGEGPNTHLERQRLNRRIRRWGPLTTGSIVRGALKEQGLLSRRASQALRDAVAAALGPRDLAHVRIVGMRRGVVTLAVDSASRRAELEGFEMPRILRALRLHAASVRVDAVRFVLGTFDSTGDGSTNDAEVTVP